MTPQLKLAFQLSNDIIAWIDDAINNKIDMPRGDLQGCIEAMALHYINEAVNLNK